MDRELKTDSIDKILSLSKEDLKEVFDELSLSEIEDLMLKVKERVEYCEEVRICKVIRTCHG